MSVILRGAKGLTVSVLSDAELEKEADTLSLDNSLKEGTNTPGKKRLDFKGSRTLRRNRKSRMLLQKLVRAAYQKL